MEHFTSFQSGNIARISYEKSSSTLEIEFHSGAVYQYFDIPLNIYQEFMGAGSKGQYFAAHIKGYYRYVKV